MEFPARGVPAWDGREAREWRESEERREWATEESREGREEVGGEFMEIVGVEAMVVVDVVCLGKAERVAVKLKGWSLELSSSSPTTVQIIAPNQHSTAQLSLHGFSRQAGITVTLNNI